MNIFLIIIIIFFIFNNNNKLIYSTLSPSNHPLPITSSPTKSKSPTKSQSPITTQPTIAPVTFCQELENQEYKEYNYLQSNNILYKGQKIIKDGYYISINNDNSFGLKDYNNITLYNSDTTSILPTYLYLQSDGNLVLYDCTGKALWISFTLSGSDTILRISDTYQIELVLSSNNNTIKIYGTIQPSKSPITSSPSLSPITSSPTLSPITTAPSLSPTLVPTNSPITSAPTTAPITSSPTLSPITTAPSLSPTLVPTNSPITSSPTTSPITSSPTFLPSYSPTQIPTLSPSQTPTSSPITSHPTFSPITSSPTLSPITSAPSNSPTFPTSNPTTNPTSSPFTSSPSLSPNLGYFTHDISIIQNNNETKGTIELEFQYINNINKSPGDFNNDGYNDLIFSTNSSNTYIILFGNNYENKFHNISIENVKSGLIDGIIINDELSNNMPSSNNNAIADFVDINGDGFDDILIGTNYNKIYVIYGVSSINKNIIQPNNYCDGINGFIFKYEDSSPKLIKKIKNFNNDKYEDVLLSFEDNTIILIYGGNFKIKKTITITNEYLNGINGKYIGVSEINDISIADLNNDKIDDILVSGPNLGITIIYGITSSNEDLSFANLQQIDSNPNFVNTGDINNDGVYEILVGYKTYLKIIFINQVYYTNQQNIIIQQHNPTPTPILLNPTQNPSSNPTANFPTNYPSFSPVTTNPTFYPTLFPTIPSSWYCSSWLYNDGVCHCGCGANDIDCDIYGNLYVTNCEFGYCDNGICKFGTQPTPKPTNSPTPYFPNNWICDIDLYNNGVCNCECGETDPDCTSSNNYNVDGCSDGICDNGICVPSNSFAKISGFLKIGDTSFGDVNNDNIDDIIISDLLGNSVYILYGNTHYYDKSDKNININKYFDNTFGEGKIFKNIYSNNLYGKSISILDFNGDKQNDFIILSNKIAYLYKTQNKQKGLKPDDKELNFNKFQEDSLFGSESIILKNTNKKIGDFNNDKFDDLIFSVADSTKNNTYKIYLIYGKPQLQLNNIKLDELDTNSGFEIILNEDFKIDSIYIDFCNFNDDEYSDIVISSSPGNRMVIVYGTSILFYSNINTIDTVSNIYDLIELYPTKGLIIQSRDSVNFGKFVTSIGDLNNDGVDDIMIPNFLFYNYTYSPTLTPTKLPTFSPYPQTNNPSISPTDSPTTLSPTKSDAPTIGDVTLDDVLFYSVSFSTYGYIPSSYCETYKPASTNNGFYCDDNYDKVPVLNYNNQDIYYKIYNTLGVLSTANIIGTSGASICTLSDYFSSSFSYICNPLSTILSCSNYYWTGYYGSSLSTSYNCLNFGSSYSGYNGGLGSCSESRPYYMKYYAYSNCNNYYPFVCACRARLSGPTNYPTNNPTSPTTSYPSTVPSTSPSKSPITKSPTTSASPITSAPTTNTSLTSAPISINTDLLHFVILGSSNYNSISNIEIEESIISDEGIKIDHNIGIENNYTFIEAGDFNGDGFNDISYQYNNNIRIYFGGNLNFKSFFEIIIDGNNTLNNFIFYDFNLDDISDVLIYVNENLYIVNGFVSYILKNESCILGTTCYTPPPTNSPSLPTLFPTYSPSTLPTLAPTIAPIPTVFPTSSPSSSPTFNETIYNYENKAFINEYNNFDSDNFGYIEIIIDSNITSINDTMLTIYNDISDIYTDINGSEFIYRKSFDSCSLSIYTFKASSELSIQNKIFGFFGRYCLQVNNELTHYIRANPNSDVSFTTGPTACQNGAPPSAAPFYYEGTSTVFEYTGFGTADSINISSSNYFIKEMSETTSQTKTIGEINTYQNLFDDSNRLCDDNDRRRVLSSDKINNNNKNLINNNLNNNIYNNNNNLINNNYNNNKINRKLNSLNDVKILYPVGDINNNNYNDFVISINSKNSYIIDGEILLNNVDLENGININTIIDNNDYNLKIDTNDVEDIVIGYGDFNGDNQIDLTFFDTTTDVQSNVVGSFSMITISEEVTTSNPTNYPTKSPIYTTPIPTTADQAVVFLEDLDEISYTGIIIGGIFGMLFISLCFRRILMNNFENNQNQVSKTDNKNRMELIQDFIFIVYQEISNSSIKLKVIVVVSMFDIVGDLIYSIYIAYDDNVKEDEKNITNIFVITTTIFLLLPSLVFMIVERRLIFKVLKTVKSNTYFAFQIPGELYKDFVLTIEKYDELYKIILKIVFVILKFVFIILSILLAPVFGILGGLFTIIIFCFYIFFIVNFKLTLIPTITHTVNNILGLQEENEIEDNVFLTKSEIEAIFIGNTSIFLEVLLESFPQLIVSLIFASQTNRFSDTLFIISSSGSFLSIAFNIYAISYNWFNKQSLVLSLQVDRFKLYPNKQLPNDKQRKTNAIMQNL